ncbi:MAG TPA: AAA family ATPase [Candidatus Paceibacterota bacterium]|nr:AAA family ATPase [Candidatus Paceibacterota bacterium]
MPTNSLIIGITGTIGAGKGEAVNYLTHHCGFKHYSVRDYLTRELERRGVPIDRPAFFALSNELRNEHGGEHIVKELFAEAEAAGGDAIIESIRARGEVLFLKDLPNFLLLGVDAPASIRYQRILKRGSATDHVTFEEFLIQERNEMASENPNKQNLQYCLQASHVIVENLGSLPEFYEKIDAAVHRFRDI